MFFSILLDFSLVKSNQRMKLIAQNLKKQYKYLYSTKLKLLSLEHTPLVDVEFFASLLKCIVVYVGLFVGFSIHWKILNFVVPKHEQTCIIFCLWHIISVVVGRHPLRGGHFSVVKSRNSKKRFYCTNFQKNICSDH